MIEEKELKHREAVDRAYEEGYSEGSKDANLNYEMEMEDGGWQDYLIEEARQQGIDPLEPFTARYDAAERRWFFEQGADQ